MPEPNYAGDDAPGCVSLAVGTIVVAILFILMKSCIWSG